MYCHMALFGPWMPNWWLKKLEKGGVVLIKTLDHHKHRLLIIYMLYQGTTSSSGVYKWVSNMGIRWSPRCGT